MQGVAYLIVDPAVVNVNVMASRTTFVDTALAVRMSGNQVNMVALR